MALRIFVASILLAIVTSCTEYRSVQRAEGTQQPYDFSVGDTVQLTTTTEGVLTLKITEITDTSLKGNVRQDLDIVQREQGVEPLEREIAFSDIQQASKETIDVGETAKGAGISLGAILLYGFALAALTYGLF